MTNIQQSSPGHVRKGIALGFALQPVSLLIVFALINIFTRDSESRGWAVLGMVLGYPLYFGMAQVLTILPAALLLFGLGKPNTVRGLLYFGTASALLNIITLLASHPVILPGSI